MSYDMRHGGPYDRGSADAWYGRPFDPHYYKGATYSTERVEAKDMTEGEREAYAAGYTGETGRKDYGTFDDRDTFVGNREPGDPDRFDA